MDIFKEGTRKGIRFNTSKGPLSIEQLWSMSKTGLAKVVRNLKKELSKNEDDDLLFLDDSAPAVDRTAQLMFDIAKSIYVTRKEEREAEASIAENKSHNERIMSIVKKKRDQKEEEMSEEDLLALLR